jgi:c-di-GMP-binding flagellar brake protein YcgR
MSQAELLTTQQQETFLRQAVEEGLCGTLSSLHDGKWNVFDVLISTVDEAGIHLHVMSENAENIDLKKDQPVGICIQKEFQKYIFESCISMAQTAAPAAKIILELPDNIQKMQRRAYERQPIPAELNVKATFWHRGYMHGSKQAPHEDYWQGKLENLSAGGAMIRVGSDQGDAFSTGQLVGVQFTPMSYQKPLLLEGHVRHLHPLTDKEGLTVGVEFLGLEASTDGHNLLHRLLDVIAAYEKLNKKSNTKA